MGYNLLDVSEFCEYSVTRFDKGANTGGFLQNNLTCSEIKRRIIWLPILGSKGGRQGQVH